MCSSFKKHFLIAPQQKSGDEKKNSYHCSILDVYVLPFIQNRFFSRKYQGQEKRNVLYKVVRVLDTREKKKRSSHENKYQATKIMGVLLF